MVNEDFEQKLNQLIEEDPQIEEKVDQIIEEKLLEIFKGRNVQNPEPRE